MYPAWRDAWHVERSRWVNRWWCDPLCIVGDQGNISLAAAFYSIAIGLPDPGTEWLADAEAHSHSRQYHQHDDGNLDEDPVPLAHFGEALARPLVELVGLRLLLPVGLTWPHLTICAALELALARGLHATAIVFACGSGGDHGLDVGVEWVEVAGR